MNRKWLLASGIALFSSASIGVSAGPMDTAASAPPPLSAPARHAELLVSGLGDVSGSTVGPDGALYVTHGATGKITRVDPRTGRTRTFASGLPTAIIGLGGVMDVAFIDRTAYALVTLVGPDVGGSNVVGIYRVDGPNRFTVIADIGEFSVNNPPRTPFDVPSGLQFALEFYRGGFLVTDGHHNRVLRVMLNGRVSEFIGFDNIVPTGLAVLGDWVFMAEAGPVPHLPEDGKVVLLGPKGRFASEVASGASLLVDVELSHGRSLYALSQGEFPAGGTPATPALPNTGALVKVNWDGSFRVLTEGLNLPTSLEFIGNVAYIATLNGEIWKIDLHHHHH
jgi:hypothetical protein